MLFALDLSGANTGWASWEPGQQLPTISSIKLCDGRHQYAAACIEVHKLLGAKHKEHGITHLAREEEILLPSDKLVNLRLSIGIATHAESWAKVKNVPCTPIASRAWRGTWLPDAPKGTKGEIWKTYAIERARQYGLDPLSHDEAEAAGVLDHLMLKLKITPPWRLALPLLPTL